MQFSTKRPDRAKHKGLNSLNSSYLKPPICNRLHVTQRPDSQKRRETQVGVLNRPKKVGVGKGRSQASWKRKESGELKKGGVKHVG